MKRIQDDFQQAEVTSLPVTLADPRRRLRRARRRRHPAAARHHRGAAALGLTALFSHVMRVDESINSVILLVGLAVGVDYSLFYLRRAREERARGLSSADALQAAAATSGRAVLFSGFVVMTAMSGMFLMGSQIFASFGVGTVLVVAIALVGSLTVLPAVLSKLGDRVERGRIPFLARMRAHGRRVALLGRGRRRRDAPPGRLGRRGGRRCWSPSRSPRSASTRSTRARRASRATCR